MFKPFTIALAVAFAVQAAPASAFFKICNKAEEEMYVAIGYSADDEWVAEGWWKIEPTECRNVIDGPLQSRYYYVRGEGVDGGIWGGDNSFCTTSTRFYLVDHDDCVSSRIDRENFFQVDTGDSKEWTHNFQP